jgi:hypothetical protein
MNNWVPAHLAADGANGPYTMGYLERDDIPFQFALAENFTICDNYHCSVLGPTWPNRLYHMSAWIDPAGAGGGPIISNIDPTPYEWRSYPEALTNAGVPWQVYQEVDNYECNLLEMFKSFQAAPVGSTLHQSALRTFSPGQFEYDAIHDRLPVVSWLVPTSCQSEHPDYTPAAGADFVASKIDAIAANPDVWNSTVFILNYDENDGIFDHVVPPTAPAGTANEYIDSLPIGGGFRVPCIIVSPSPAPPRHPRPAGRSPSPSAQHDSRVSVTAASVAKGDPHMSADNGTPKRWSRRRTFIVTGTVAAGVAAGALGTAMALTGTPVAKPPAASAASAGHASRAVISQAALTAISKTAGTDPSYYAYLAAAGGDEVVEVNVAAASIVGTVSADTVEGVAAAPDGSEIYLAETGQYYVLAVNPVTKASKQIEVGPYPQDIAQDALRHEPGRGHAAENRRRKRRDHRRDQGRGRAAGGRRHA